MLKVADGYDLKELNKYGFVYHYESYDRNYFNMDFGVYDIEAITAEYYTLTLEDEQIYLTVYIDEKYGRELKIDCGYDSYISDRFSDVIFDLVKDGVVEKVSRKWLEILS